MGNFIMYINIENEGWKAILLTKNSQPLKYMIEEIYKYDENVEVLITYVENGKEEKLLQFNNFISERNLDLSKIYEKAALIK